MFIKQYLFFFLLTPGLIHCQKHTPETKIHQAFQLGATIDEIRPLLSSACASLDEKNYTGELAAPFKEQTQLDCFELEVFGARRKVEFMFNDGPLGHLWILIEPSELNTLKSKLTEYFGDVVFETDEYAVFASETVALRNNPPEILVANQDLMRDLTGYNR